MEATPIVIQFESSILRLALFPDSRGYVQFALYVKGNTDWQPLETGNALTSEYLTDLLEVTIGAMAWIVQNCTNIKAEDGRHLYFAFKPATPVGSRYAQTTA